MMSVLIKTLVLVASGPRAQDAINELVGLFDREFDLKR